MAISPTHITTSCFGSQWAITYKDGKRIAVHSSSGDEYGTICNTTDREIRKVMLQEGLWNCTVGLPIKMIARTIYILSGCWAWHSGYQEGLKAWKAAKREFVKNLDQGDRKISRSPPGNFYLCAQVARYSLYHLATSLIKLATQPVATVLSILANLTAIVDPLDSRRFSSLIAKTWMINTPHLRYLWMEDCLNYIASCMLPSQIWRDRNRYQYSYTYQEKATRSQNTTFFNTISKNKDYFSLTEEKLLFKAYDLIKKVIDEKCLSPEEEAFFENKDFDDNYNNPALANSSWATTYRSTKKTQARITNTIKLRNKSKTLNNQIQKHLENIDSYTEGSLASSSPEDLDMSAFNQLKAIITQIQNDHPDLI